MPHDRDGNLLAVGDTVSVPCIVKEIHQTEDYCNVMLHTQQAMPPSHDRTVINLNAKQVVKS
jgi:hypothetical protein